MTTYYDNKRLPLTLDIQFFAEAEGEETTQDEETQEKTFTQAELDEIIAKRVARVKAEPPADYEELKKKLADFEAQQAEAERAKMSEIERLQADLKAKEEAEQTLAKQLEEMREQTKKAAIHNAFMTQAQAAGITYTDAALKLADLTAAEVGEDGNVSGVDVIIAKLVEDNPFLIAKKQAEQIGDPSNGGRGTADEKTKEQQLEEARQKAIETGRAEDRAAYAQLKRELGL